MGQEQGGKGNKACDEIDDVNRYRPVAWGGPRD